MPQNTRCHEIQSETITIMAATLTTKSGVQRRLKYKETDVKSHFDME